MSHFKTIKTALFLLVYVTWAGQAGCFVYYYGLGLPFLFLTADEGENGSASHSTPAPRIVIGSTFLR